MVDVLEPSANCWPKSFNMEMCLLNRNGAKFIQFLLLFLDHWELSKNVLSDLRETFEIP